MDKKMDNKKLAAVVAALVMAASSVPAHATILATATYIYDFYSGTSSSVVPLNNDGTTAVPLRTSKTNTKVRIIFNAQCGVLGSTGATLSATILVDGVQANPASGTSFAFCSAPSSWFWSLSGASRQSLINVPAIGAHNVTVRADLNYGASYMDIDAISLVVDD
jgi:hypothetical protein